MLGLDETGKEVPLQQDLVTVDLRLGNVLSERAQSLRQGRIREDFLEEATF